MVCDFDPFCVFQGSLLVLVPMIDGSDKHHCEGACSHVCESAVKSPSVSEAPGSGGINGQSTVCFSILLVFIKYNISV